MPREAKDFGNWTKYSYLSLESNHLLLLSVDIWQLHTTVLLAHLLQSSFIITAGMKYLMNFTFCWSCFLTNTQHQLGMTEGINSLPGYLNCEQSSLCRKSTQELLRALIMKTCESIQMLHDQMPPKDI